MAEQLGSLARTHTCGALRPADVGVPAVLLGWVHRVRDLGALLFLDVRDRHGLTQVIVEGDEALLERAKRLRSEFVVAILGDVERRAPETVNLNVPTGEVEVRAREIRVLNEAKTPPFTIAEDSNVSEETRLKYRYLDLRRPHPAAQHRAASRITLALRKYFNEQGFYEIETPILTKSTPEGARDFLVPSRVHPGEFYALPQSPQIFKQILMIRAWTATCRLPAASATRRCAPIASSSSRRSISRFRLPRRTWSTSIVEGALAACFTAKSASRSPAVPPDAVRRGDREVRFRQAGPAVRPRDPGLRTALRRVAVRHLPRSGPTAARCAASSSPARRLLAARGRRAGRAGQAIRRGRPVWARHTADGVQVLGEGHWR
jgi:hypothetical protein